MTDRPQPGRYRHFRGAEYDVIGTARHSETGEALVVYRALYGHQTLWVRPLASFMGEAVDDGERVPRFQRIEEGGA